MSSNIHYASSCGGIVRDPHEARFSQITTAPWHVLTALWSVCQAVRDGLVAHQRYEQLRSRGVPHDPAIREALGIGGSAALPACAVAPLGFAGRA